MFPMVLLKNGSGCVLGGTLQSTAPVSESAEVLHLPVRSCSGPIVCKRAHASRLVSSAFDLHPTVHLFSVAGVRPLRMPLRRYAFSARSTGESPGVLSTNTSYSVSVVTRLPAMGNARSWMFLGTRRCQVGSAGNARSRMLLGTRRYQVGSDGGSSIVDAS